MTGQIHVHSLDELRGMTKARGRGVRRQPGVMNKTEAAYNLDLKRRKIAGDVLWYAFDAVKLRLADKTFYTPDFIVMLADLRIQFHEVKGGFWEDDARVKIKVAAAMYPFEFYALQPRGKSAGGGWKSEAF